MAELKPCPFCGGNAEFKRTVIKTNGAWCDAVCVRCTVCDARTNRVLYDAKKHPNCEEYEEAAADWNRRVVDAVEVTAQEIQFLIDAMYRHVRWMIAGRLNKPECSYDERVALLEKLRLFEREHFPDMNAETEG